MRFECFHIKNILCWWMLLLKLHFVTLDVFFRFKSSSHIHRLLLNACFPKWRYLKGHFKILKWKNNFHILKLFLNDKNLCLLVFGRYTKSPLSSVLGSAFQSYYNPGQNILRLFDVLPIFLFPASETMDGY